MKVLLGLGANLGDPLRAFAAALAELAALHDLRAVSRVYRSRAVGPAQPDYWNMAALLHGRGTADELLARCQRLERAAGRRREGVERWGPRPLDLDLLLIEGEVVDRPDLTVPHPHLLERAFALVPAADLAPHWRHPVDGRALADLARGLELAAGLRRWAASPAW